MRVLYLIDSLVAGGAERSLAALAPYYANLGVDLRVAYLYERDNVWRPALESAGAQVISLGASSGLVARARHARQLIGELEPDIVHTTLFDADIVGRLACATRPVPVVCSIVNAAYGPAQWANPAVKRWKLEGVRAIDAATAPLVTRFHAVSIEVATMLRQKLFVPARRIDVVPRGRDAAEMGTRTAERRARARRTLMIDDQTPIVLAVGRHEHQKAFDVLLRAFARVEAGPRAPLLLIAGRDGNSSEALRADVDALGLGARVRMLGVRDDVPDVMCAADVFALTSRWEGSPGALIEAMALETPAVATDIAAVREVVGDTGAVRLVAVDDVEALTAAITSELVRGADREAATRTARERFLERFTIESVASQMVHIYERALADRAGARRGRRLRTARRRRAAGSSR